MHHPIVISNETQGILEVLNPQEILNDGDVLVVGSLLHTQKCF